MDYRLVENEGLFQEYLEMGELLLYLSMFFEFLLRKPTIYLLDQGRLKIWTEHSTLILLISIPFELA